MQVAKIDVKQETPVNHGEIICFSIYSGPEVDFGNGKSCIWVDVLAEGGKTILAEFAPFFEDTSIKKAMFPSLILLSLSHHFVEKTGLILYAGSEKVNGIIYCVLVIIFDLMKKGGLSC